MNMLRRSIGTGKMTVEWCSADISVSVWSMRSWRVVGVAAITLPASASFSAAWYSPSAWITFARRSRSASAWRGLARGGGGGGGGLLLAGPRRFAGPLVPARGGHPLPPPFALRLGLAGDDA